MALIPSQWPALKANILANTTPIDFGGALIAINALPLTADASIAIAAWYNGLIVPDFWVWRTLIEESEVVQKVSRTGTTFIWAGNGFITRSAGEMTAWDRLFRLGCNPSLGNVRQAFLDIFSGAGNAALNRAHLDIVARRQATRIERVFATGIGADSSATAGSLVFEGVVTGAEIDDARHS